jgi:hypothetical protein
MNAPVKGLFSPEEMQSKFGIKVDPVPEETPSAYNRGADESGKKKKKKKKKKASAMAAAVNADMFFEGGSDEDLPEWIGDSQLEGGSDEEIKEDEAAESVKPKSKKKKKKKKGKAKQFDAADTFKDTTQIVAPVATESKAAMDTIRVDPLSPTSPVKLANDL